MNGTATVIGVHERRDSTLQRILNHIFRCSHRHKSHPLTPRGEDQCYSACLDCGKRILQDRPFEPNSASQEVPQGRKDEIREIGKRKPRVAERCEAVRNASPPPFRRSTRAHFRPAN